MTTLYDDNMRNKLSFWSHFSKLKKWNSNGKHWSKWEYHVMHLLILTGKAAMETTRVRWPTFPQICKP
jgi:hypothetical protein